MNFGKILILIYFFAINCIAGVGGTGGGNSPKPKYQLISVLVCDELDPGTQCRTVRFYDRPKSENLAPECFVYHGDSTMIPCPDNYKKTNFITDIIKYFVNQGFNTKIVEQSL